MMQVLDIYYVFDIPVSFVVNNVHNFDLNININKIF